MWGRDMATIKVLPGIRGGCVCHSVRDGPEQIGIVARGAGLRPGSRNCATILGSTPSAWAIARFDSLNEEGAGSENRESTSSATTASNAVVSVAAARVATRIGHAEVGTSALVCSTRAAHAARAAETARLAPRWSGDIREVRFRRSVMHSRYSSSLNPAA